MFEKKQAIEKTGKQKTFLGTFWKILNKTIAFNEARSPSKLLVYVGAEGASRKVLASICKNECPKIKPTWRGL